MQATTQKLLYYGYPCKKFKNNLYHGKTIFADSIVEVVFPHPTVQVFVGYPQAMSLS